MTKPTSSADGKHQSPCRLVPTVADYASSRPGVGLVIWLPLARAVHRVCDRFQGGGHARAAKTLAWLSTSAAEHEGGTVGTTGRTDRCTPATAVPRSCMGPSGMLRARDKGIVHSRPPSVDARSRCCSSKDLLKAKDELVCLRPSCLYEDIADLAEGREAFRVA